MRSLALITTQQRRLEKLARDTGHTPDAMLRFVAGRSTIVVRVPARERKSCMN